MSLLEDACNATYALESSLETTIISICKVRVTGHQVHHYDRISLIDGAATVLLHKYPQAL